jgi:F-type H+-transporting ATPase subunit beta
MATGKITQIIGAVIDVEFPRDSIPKIYEALKLKDVDLTLEVQQQLGDGVVRTIAMGASEGLKRGLEVETTGAPISVPVGRATLGRIMDVLGAPQDNRGPVAAKEHWPIHRPAPSYDEQAGGNEARFVAWWDGSAWSALDTGLNDIGEAAIQMFNLRV